MCFFFFGTMQIMHSEPNYAISHLGIIPEALKRVRLSRANQNSGLGTDKNTNFNSSQNHMNDLQSTFLILSESFSSTSCCFSSGITLQIVAF